MVTTVDGTAISLGGGFYGGVNFDASGQVEVGDIVVAVVSLSSSPTEITAPSGWDRFRVVRSDFGSPPGTSTPLWAYAKQITSASDDDWTFSHTSTVIAQGAALIFSGKFLNDLYPMGSSADFPCWLVNRSSTLIGETSTTLNEMDLLDASYAPEFQGPVIYACQNTSQATPSTTSFDDAEVTTVYDEAWVTGAGFDFRLVVGYEWIAGTTLPPRSITSTATNPRIERMVGAFNTVLIPGIALPLRRVRVNALPYDLRNIRLGGELNA